jgi:hypothetical protein
LKSICSFSVDGPSSGSEKTCINYQMQLPNYFAFVHQRRVRGRASFFALGPCAAVLAVLEELEAGKFCGNDLNCEQRLFAVPGGFARSRRSILCNLRR